MKRFFDYTLPNAKPDEVLLDTILESTDTAPTMIEKLEFIGMNDEVINKLSISKPSKIMEVRNADVSMVSEFSCP